MPGSSAGGSANMPRQSTNRPRLAVRVAAPLVALAFTLGLLEVALRLVPGAIPAKLLVLFEPGLRARIASGAYPLQKDFRPVPRDDGGPPLFAAKPDTVIVSLDPVPDGRERSTDELGFCNPRGRYDGRERIDLVAIGDSFTWCHAVHPEQAWPALLGERTGLSAYSLGLGGKGPNEYVQYLREFGVAKKPRIVVMNVYGGNDLRDAMDWRDYRDAVARGEEPPSELARPYAPALLAGPVGRHSYVFNVVHALVSRATSQNPRDRERKGIDFEYELLLENGGIPFNVENRDRDEVVTARHVADGSESPALWQGAVDRLAALSREHGFTAVISYTPSAHAAWPGEVRFTDPSIGPLVTALDEAQRGFLAKRCAEQGILFHDLGPDLEAASSRSDATALLYDPVHVHLTARGNQVVAASLAAFLKQKGLADPK